MSQLAKNSFRNFLTENITAVRYWIGLIAAYLGTKVFALTSTVAFAADPSSRVAGDSFGNSDNAFADLFFKFLGPLQDFGTVILILAAVICGIKIGGSSVMGDARSRTNAIVGLFFILIGEVVILHAQALVGMAINLK